MYVAHLHFAILFQTDENTVSHAINGILGTWRMNGQICGKEWPTGVDEQEYTATVLLPEISSLDMAHNNSYGNKELQRLAQSGLDAPGVSLIRELEGEPACECPQNERYVLYTRYHSLESPLRCGDCFHPIPLYRIPSTQDDEYYDIICWQSDYQCCDTLQMNCRTLERASMRQISRWDSPLSQKGIAICQRIETLTGKPTYYYLYRYGARSYKKEVERRCPSCGGEWRLEEPYHLCDFKCDRCRILSNIAWDVR